MEEETARYITDSELYARTGIQKMSINTIYQLMYLKKTNRLNRTEKLLLIPDYFHYKLTGVAKTEYTNATTTNLVSAHTRNWDDQIIKTLGFPREIFCEITPPGPPLGGLLPEIQVAVGYNCQIIVPATHDTASAVAALPKTDTLFISSGTWSLMGTQLPAPNCTEESRLKNFTNEGGYQNRYRYLKNIMGLWLIQNIKKELNNKFTYSQLNEMAESANIQTTINANDPRLLSPKNMHETIKQICRETNQQVPQTPGETAAVIYQSLAASYAKTAAEIEEITGKKFPEICIMGGGAKAEYLNKLTAKFCQKTVITGETEATATGNLIVQMETYK
jgi:rhamnulokinase